MFSQLRKRLEDGLDAVEHLAQHQSARGASPDARRGSGSSVADSTSTSTASNPGSPAGAGIPRSASPARPPTTDAHGGAKVPFTSPSLLAQSAFSSLQRSLALPRMHPSGTGDAPQPPRLSRQSSVGSGNDRELEDVGQRFVSGSGEKDGSSRLTLEDRLKATFVLGDDESGTATPVDGSERTLGSTAITPVRPLSASPPPLELGPTLDPVEIPLPDSPLAEQVELPLSASMSTSEVDHPLSPEPHRKDSSASTAIPSISLPEDAESPTTLSPRTSEDAHLIPLPVSHRPSMDIRPTSPDPSTAEDEPPTVPLSLSRVPSDLFNLPPEAPPPAEGEQDEEKIRLRERLELVEQRFSEISTSFKRLQAERTAATKVLREMTPVESLGDVEGLENHLKNLGYKVEVSAEEVKRLNAQIRQQEERMEELRDTHRLEGLSRSQQVDQLQKSLTAAQTQLSSAADDSRKKQTEIDRLNGEVDRLKGVAKEEEEKRTKAISLLKTVRQKLVKAEKDREEAVRDKEEAGKRERENVAREREGRERAEQEVERVRAERERDVAGLRAQFEREVQGVRERVERENKQRKAQYELEAITAKATYDKELASRTARIAQLESTRDALSAERDSLFDQLQLRQAEHESAQSALELAHAQLSEAQYQLREMSDRLAVMSEELADARRRGEVVEGEMGSRQAAEVTRLLADAERKAESKLSDLRERLRAMERERANAEEEWSRDMAERGREVERLRRVIGEKDGEYEEAVRTRRERDERVSMLEGERKRLDVRVREGEAKLEVVQREVERLKSAEAHARQETSSVSAKFAEMEKQLEELRARETQLRNSNKTLRDELRKVQSSAALLERGRNPGVGYWSTRANGGPTTPGADVSAAASTSDVRSRSSTETTGNGNGVLPPTPSSPSRSEVSVAKSSEEEINMEYLRNVILQFLEHKEMRPNLVRVLSVILHFTPQETRRIIAKV